MKVPAIGGMTPNFLPVDFQLSYVPGHIATDLNGHAGTRTVKQGAKIIVDLAKLPDSAPAGGYFNEDGPLPGENNS